MRPALRSALCAALVLCGAWGGAAAPAGATGPAEGGGPARDEAQPDDLRYLLLRRLGRPEKDYWDLSRVAKLLEPLGVDVIVDTGVRYDVSQAWRVRVTRSTDSLRAARSHRPAVYVLRYPRRPEWVFCARTYRFEVAADGRRSLAWTDFPRGREQALQLGPSWPRPWEVDEIEVVEADVLDRMQRRSTRPTTDGSGGPSNR